MHGRRHISIPYAVFDFGCLCLSLCVVVFCLIHRSLFGNCVRSSVWPAPMSDLTIVQINLISGYKNKFFAFAFYPQPKTNIFDCNVCACKYVSMSFVYSAHLSFCLFPSRLECRRFPPLSVCRCLFLKFVLFHSIFFFGPADSVRVRDIKFNYIIFVVWCEQVLCRSESTHKKTQPIVRDYSNR